jgi:hypothetical protein
MFGGAAQAFSPKPGTAEASGANDEIAKLKAELAALKAKVDKLG